MVLCSSSRSEPLGNELSSWMLAPTASAVRCYTETQSCLAAAVFPSILSGNSALLLLSLCNGGSIRIDTQHSLFLLIDCTTDHFDRISLSMSTSCSLVELSYSLVWSSGQLNAVSNTLVLFSFSVVVVHYHRL